MEPNAIYPKARRHFPLLGVVTLASLLAACSAAPEEGENEGERNETSDALAACPTGGVSVSPGPGTLAAAVASHGANTTFCLQGGATYVLGERVTLKAATKVFGIGASRAIVTGNDVTPGAFNGNVADVVFGNLQIEHFSDPDHPGDGGTIYAGRGTNWTVRNCLLQHNEPRAIRLGDGMKVLRSVVQYNSASGIGGGAAGVVIDGNTIAYNNDRHYSLGFDAGGVKLVGPGHIVRNNVVHHNDGNGIWFDVGSRDAVVVNNTVEDNTAQGIMYEISCGSLSVSGNTVRRNGFGRGNGGGYGAGIFISSSGATGAGNVFDISNNVVENNHNGIAVVQQDTRDHCGVLTVSGVNVHDNVVRMSTADKVGTGTFARTGFFNVSDPSNRFVNNTYYLHSATDSFFHSDAGNVTTSAWTKTGQDVTGTFAAY